MIYNLHDIAYTFYLRFCRENGYGIMSQTWFIKNKNNNPRFYKKAIITQRNDKINKIIKKT